MGAQLRRGLRAEFLRAASTRGARLAWRRRGVCAAACARRILRHGGAAATAGHRGRLRADARPGPRPAPAARQPGAQRHRVEQARQACGVLASPRTPRRQHRRRHRPEPASAYPGDGNRTHLRGQAARPTARCSAPRRHACPAAHDRRLRRRRAGAAETGEPVRRVHHARPWRRRHGPPHRPLAGVRGGWRQLDAAGAGHHARVRARRERTVLESARGGDDVQRLHAHPTPRHGRGGGPALRDFLGRHRQRQRPHAADAGE